MTWSSHLNANVYPNHPQDSYLDNDLYAQARKSSTTYPLNQTRTPLSWSTFFTVFLPPVVLYYLVVLLLVCGSRMRTRGVRIVRGSEESAVEKERIGTGQLQKGERIRLEVARLALIPLTLVFAYRAAVTLDFSGGKERMVYMNQSLSLGMFALSMRVIVWGFLRVPVVRGRPATDTPSLLLDAADLAFSLRGIGWSVYPVSKANSDSESKYKAVATSGQRENPYPTVFNAYIPTPQSTNQSILHAFLSFLTNFIMFDTLHYTVQSLIFHTSSFPYARTVYAPQTYPALTRYAFTFLLTLLSGLTIYASMQTIYNLCAFLSLLLLNHKPSQWPPAFDKPWKAQSLADFWGKRWHQFFRVDFVGFGCGAVDVVFNSLVSLYGGGGGGGTTKGWLKYIRRTLQVFAAFLVSGLLHYAGLWGMGRPDFSSNSLNALGTIGFFLLMGLGVFLEGLWRAVTGRRVIGWVGRVWTMSWVLGWGQLLVDAWARSGMIDSLFVEEKWRLASMLFGEIVYPSSS